MRLKLLSLALALVVTLVLAADCPDRLQAATNSQQTAFVKERPSDLSINEGGVRLVRYRYSRVIRGTQNPLKAFQGGPALVFDVLNEGLVPRDFAVAVALFDREGHLVGVGTQSHTGKLDPGETNEMKIVLKDVNQEVSRAATLVVALETRR